MSTRLNEPYNPMTVRQAARNRHPLDGTDAQALEHALTQAEDEILTLKAMIEQAERPKHVPSKCGSNDCPACEWTAFAEKIRWPSWGIPHLYEGYGEVCENCGQPADYDLHK